MTPSIYDRYIVWRRQNETIWVYWFFFAGNLEISCETNSILGITQRQWLLYVHGYCNVLTDTLGRVYSTLCYLIHGHGSYIFVQTNQIIFALHTWLTSVSSPEDTQVKQYNT